ncbi:uncharacterized protein LOC127839897 [Dreissena polymorpha]|uniref:uncharacterized protein LOC127839897 n=1 Tax=Dreissena polymorpha TaxID=45954 RepID=UPI002264F5AD|nr:uncharacterized protein LOC127839897 [Dreissena polymorpha]
MAEIRRRIRQLRRVVRIERVFQDRLNPLEVLSDEEIVRRYRFRSRTIMDIVEVLFPFLERPTKRSSPLPPLLSVLVTLYFFASGAHYVVIEDVHGVSAPSICRSVNSVVKLLARMGLHRIKFPRVLGDTKAKFYSIAGIL